MKKLLFILLPFCFIKANAQTENIALTATVTTSYVSPWESLTAVNDGFTPSNSNDHDNGAYGNWPNPDSLQWVQYGWPAQQTISKAEIYWFDDGGGVLVPTTAYLEYWNGSAWVRLADVPKDKDAFNTVEFSAITTDSIRVSMKNSVESTGILEWRVYGTAGPAVAKRLYIPDDWKNASLNIPWDSTARCKQSANFAVFWGPLAGNDPMNATDANLRFNPQTVLDSMEAIFDDYVNKWHLIPDSGNQAKYKSIVVMNDTWRDGLYTGFAFGGGFDNVISAMFVHPSIFNADAFTASHEFTHACQYMITNVLYPGHGFNDVYSGFFWETHANWMALQRYPSFVGATDNARALSFTSYTMSSARKHYANFYYLELLKEKYGIDFVGRIWREADYSGKHEHPFQTIQRLLGTDQSGVNAFFMEHAMHNVKWDYRNTEIKTQMENIGQDVKWHPTVILDSLSANHYAIPDRQAPQQYGYNVIRLYPEADTCPQHFVHVKFKGHEDSNAGSGWLYGFVSTDSAGNITYSPQYSTQEDIAYKFPSNSMEYYMVVMGAPQMFKVHTGSFEIGFPKEFRYAWEVNMAGMTPEGYQPDYHNVTAIAGAAHPNGGGFVASTAHADASAYVGPGAAVLDNATVTGNARIEDKATVAGTSNISDNAVVSGFAQLYGSSSVSGKAKVYEQAYLFGTTVTDSAKAYGNAALDYATLKEGSSAYGNVFSYGGTFGGTVEYGGDAETFGECSAGRYLQNIRPYCDGVVNAQENADTNQVYTPYTAVEMAFGKTVECGEITGNAGAPPIVDAGADQQATSADLTATLTGTATSPTGVIVSVQWTKTAGPGSYTIVNSDSLTTAVSNLEVGVYTFQLVATDNFGNKVSDSVKIIVSKVNTPPVANAGTDFTITLPANSVTFNGSASDVDNDVQSVTWMQLSGPTGAIVQNPNLYSCQVTGLTEGTYQFVITAIDSKGATGKDSVTVIVLKGIAGAAETPILAAYPIPANDMLVVTYPPIIGGRLTVFDTKGGKVFTQELGSNTTSTTFPVKSLATGVYFIRIDTYSKDVFKLKFIVSH